MQGRPNLLFPGLFISVLRIRIRSFGSPGSGSGKIPDPDLDPLSTKDPCIIIIFTLYKIVYNKVSSKCLLYPVGSGLFRSPGSGKKWTGSATLVYIVSSLPLIGRHVEGRRDVYWSLVQQFVSTTNVHKLVNNRKRTTLPLSKGI